jgi:fused signal recognition particle receptor
MTSKNKPSFWQRLLGFGSGEPPKEEPPAAKPAIKEPPASKRPQKQPPAGRRPPKKAKEKASAKKTPELKAPPPAGPHQAAHEEPRGTHPGDEGKTGVAAAPPEPGPRGPRPKGPGGGSKRGSPKRAAEGPEAPPPAGPQTVQGARTPDERPPGTREKGAPEHPETPREEPIEGPAEPDREAPEPEPDAPSKSSRRAETPGRNWFTQLRHGLARSSFALGDNLSSVLSRRKLDEATLDALEEALIKADLGVGMAARIRSAMASTRQERGIAPEALRELLAAEVAKVLAPVAKPLELAPASHPHVILLVGVNGTGKTTTAAKLAHQFMRSGHTVVLAAADTFRAAAIDQLQVWGARVGAEVVAKDVGADPAGVAYEALERARAEERDILIIDTAGRLQNKADLMAELAKIVRVLKKLDPSAPHSVVLVLDATTGQNALNQVQIFQEIAGVSSLVVTKLDGTARGGILVAIAERFGLPVNAIGVGEGVDDLQAFDANDFARAIVGLDSRNAAAA